MSRNDSEHWPRQPETHAVEKFQWLSHDQLVSMLGDPFHCEQIAQFDLEPTGVEQAPVMRLISQLLCACGSEGIKVAKSGELPHKAVNEMALVYLGYEQFWVQIKRRRLRGEGDFYLLNYTRALAEQCGLVHCHRQHLVVSDMGREMMAANDPADIYNLLFEVAVEFMEWGTLGPWPSFYFIQQGFLFSLFLLAQYGDKFRPVTVYGEMFMQALKPFSKGDPDEGVYGVGGDFAKAYAWRTMCFMGELFGLVERKSGSGAKRARPLMADTSAEYEVMKTALLDRLVSFQVPDRKGGALSLEPVIIPELLAEIRQENLGDRYWNGRP